MLKKSTDLLEIRPRTLLIQNVLALKILFFKNHWFYYLGAPNGSHKEQNTGIVIIF